MSDPSPAGALSTGGPVRRFIRVSWEINSNTNHRLTDKRLRKTPRGRTDAPQVWSPEFSLAPTLILSPSASAVGVSGGAGVERRRTFYKTIYNMQSDNDKNWIKSPQQSEISDEPLLCGDCSVKYDAARLEKTGEERYESAYVEDFECPDCGATGYVKRARETSLVTRNGCVTTPRLLDIEAMNARADLERRGRE